MSGDYSLSEGQILGERLLVEAAAAGDFDTVLRLLNNNVDAEAGEYNRTLCYADVNIKTPLQAAAKNGCLMCTELLIARGANVNAKDNFGVTALHMAAEKGNTACLKALLNANAECSLPTKYSENECRTTVPHLCGTTPLHLAAWSNHVECVKELIQYGADYNAVDEVGHTSLYIAAQRRHANCVLAHIKYVRNLVGKDILSLPSFKTSNTPLHFAVRYGMLECVKELLLSGSDVNHLNYEGYSPLHIAVTLSRKNEHVCMEMLRMLVTKGYNTDINQPNRIHHTPLHLVCFDEDSRGRFKKVFFNRPLVIRKARFLISYGANVHIKNKWGFSLLEWEVSATADSDILKYIVRSVLHPPPITKVREVISVLNTEHAYIPHAFPIGMQNIYKTIWYEDIASNPRTLQHYCRFTIRQTLGPKSMKLIKQLPIPASLQSYLLLEFGE